MEPVELGISCTCVEFVINHEVDEEAIVVLRKDSVLFVVSGVLSYLVKGGRLEVALVLL